MLTFFQGWRRKLGVVTLLISLILAMGWIRSFIKISRLIPVSTGRELQMIASCRSEIVWQKITPGDTSHWRPQMFVDIADRIASMSMTKLWYQPESLHWQWAGLGFAWDDRLEETEIAPMRVITAKLRYELILTPLTALATVLLLWRPRQDRPPSR